jgi:hypothetical protein
MATGFSGLGLGELGAESKYVGKSNTFYKPPEVRNEQGEVQVPLLQGLRQMAGKALGDELAPAFDWLQNKLSPVPPPLGAGAPVGAGVNPAYAYAPRIDTTNPTQPVYGVNSDDEIAKQVNAASQTIIH